MLSPQDVAGLAWKVQPHLSPWAGLKAILIALGLVAGLHILHHAIHFPFKAWWAERANRRRPDQFLENPNWRPGADARLRFHLRERRPKRVRS